ncbi:Crp/Fnr family transcriptional regulator [Frigidibacter oleivorans]|uniref:Crp/Fnr family transcriptional regulator n=1 Tax=Frigidibacter oleivorans TaxID=2487129 RepID=UPI000F8E9F33|nr:Crp/Fnr family transcriptional regulator [Frigidibacter oleivorans]
MTAPPAPDLSDADWTRRFDGLAGLSQDLRDRLLAAARVVHLPEGTRLFGPGQAPTAMVLLLKGAVRVQQRGENGREVLLYRVQAGDTCVLTTACLLGYEDYTAEGVAETEVIAATLPREAFDELVAASREFRQFVFAAFSRRITELFGVIEDIAFNRMDVRLAARLAALAEDGVVRVTHQALANDLGTAREVVSRLLQDFVRRGWIEQARGEIRLTAPAALARLARS